MTDNYIFKYSKDLETLVRRISMDKNEYEAIIGKRLASDVLDKKGTLLIAKGTLIH